MCSVPTYHIVLLTHIMYIIISIAHVYKTLKIFKFYLLAITVMFNQSTYSVDEDAGPARPVLVLSNPSSMAFNVQVTNTDGSAIGEHCSILINY